MEEIFVLAQTQLTKLKVQFGKLNKCSTPTPSPRTDDPADIVVVHYYPES